MCLLTCRQKLRLYKAGVCPRLSWLLLIEELPITWVERATRFLKKWAGIAKSTNVTLLYLPTKRSGLNLPALTSLYKHLQVSRQSQLLMSPDGSVRLLVERNLQHELSMMKKNRFTLNAAMDALPHNPNLHLCMGKERAIACPLCGERQTLIHALNCCRVARELRRYHQRHNGVLGILADAFKKKLPLYRSQLI